MKRNVLIIILILIVIVAGFVRDHVFVSLNEAIKSGSENTSSLIMWKWGLTAAFILFHIVLSSSVVHLLFRNYKLVMATMGTYLALVLVACVVAGISYFLFTFEKVYPLIRSILGVAQSPLIMMVMIAAGFISNRQPSGK